MNMKNDPDRKKGHLTPTDWTLNVTGPKGSTHRYKPMLEQLCVTAASPDLKLCFTCTFLSIKIYSRVETAFLEKLVNFLKTQDKLKSVVCWCFIVFVQTFHFICIISKNVLQATTWEDILFPCLWVKSFVINSERASECSRPLTPQLQFYCI